MKKLIYALVCGLMLVPLSAWGQKWIEPYTDKDGTQVEGHWQTPEDVRQEQYSTPGMINPFTGQPNINSSSQKRPQEAAPLPENSTPMKDNPYYSIPDYKYKVPDYRYQGR